MCNKYVVIDLETTGNAPKKGDKMIQFAAVVIENGKIVEEYSSLVNPGQSIPPFIEELTGLDDEAVKDAPVFSEIAPKVLTLLEDAYFVAHNVLFDLSFLQEELLLAGYNGFYGPVLDTVELSRVFMPTADSFQLSELAYREGLNHERPHQADSDAYVTAELLLLLLDRMERLPLSTIKQIYKLSGGLKSDLDLLIDTIITKKEATVEVLENDLEIHQGIALKRFHEQDVNNEHETLNYPSQQEVKEELFKKAFTNYEIRLGQFKMMDSVYQAFKHKRHALIEAGTGVGKSLAYLIPAAIYGKESGQSVIISTYTTQLQEQLLSNDIPKLKQMLPFPINAVLLKGRSHYLSLAKFEQSLKDLEDNYDTTLTKMQILVWLTETFTGDIDEINLSSGGMIFWNKIKNDETIFLQNKSWLSRDFYMKARKSALKADLIITNHSLLLTDLVSNNKILPEYSHIVIDEGHHLVKVSGQYFGYSFDYLKTRFLLGRIGQLEQKQLLYKLEQVLEKAEIENKQLIHSFEMNVMVQELSFEMDELFKIISIFAKKKSKSKKGYNRISSRFSFDDSSNELRAMKTSAERFLFLLKDFTAEVEKRLNMISHHKEKLSAKEKSSLEELVSVVEEIKEITSGIKHIFLQPSDEFVTWIEMDIRSMQNATTVYSQPVNAGHLLKEEFFSKKESAVITSATLSVKNSFNYMLNELGLKLTDCTAEQIQSPFDYNEQVKLVIPDDLPEVNSVSLDEYVMAISEHIISIAEATKGRMLILFTSHEMLKKTYELIKESGFLNDYAIIAQGVSSGSRSRLTRNFQKFEKAILLGTNSFWEGIDIPGEDLTCLIIVRLPFSPPDEPFTEAKCDLIKQKGGNPFSDYSLPEAIIRFKQGFGRLIRTRSDKGFIFIFDRRLLTTQYGKAFLDSIPKIPHTKSDINGIVELINKSM
ncbi:ATP-dependent DNA helicase DinG [Bacillus sp. DTU_2020_1000418_1_SI_GHA_SEK_038]|uniref:ATP-dependent DNA helicase DinG n=1 Tax=Bacillus sp. DTU_2020_1000418_1_SI_GHA_SEK_038 TaxID=3077585 RepID=UPI0028E30C50|nr:ATP-dependent DNA helicase DinG [Bacillus sp. DTU_2020_1000418_1_SI_GHA_SEK_038]WNS74004.1 ATP-dependent DNA helicase DinG [Bacillus sp. DTU_2020_1000418_1_SI_GHA_SEK_038]